MASYNELLALIDAYINRNGVQAITGQILNGVLKAMVDQLGRGYTLMGYAEPTGDPGTPDGPESWFASVPGTYTNYGEIQVAAGELALLSFAPSEGWTKNTIYEGFREVTADIDGNVGTPEVGVSYANGVLSFDFRNMKGNPGEDGDPAGFGSVTASVDDQVGTPSVSVSSSGPDTAKNFAFAFHNLKGETGVTSVVATVDNTSGNPQCSVSLQGGQLTLAFTGLKGAQGNTGSSVDYPFTIVNNLTTDDPTQALSAAMGVELDGKVSQLEAEVTDLDGYVDDITDKVQSSNLLDVSKMTDNKYWWGGPSDASGLCYSDKIPVTPGKTYTYQFTGEYRDIGQMRMIYGYKADNTAVADGAFQNVDSYTAPADCAYVILTIYMSRKDLDSAFVEGTTVIPYEQYGFNAVLKDGIVGEDAIEEGAVKTSKIGNSAIVTEKLANLSVVTDKIANDAVTIEKIGFQTTVESANKADPNACVHGYVNKTNGTVDTSVTTRYATDFIPITEQGLYCNRPSGYGNAGGGAVYDADKQFIRGFSGEDNAVTYQDGDAFVRFTVAVDAVEQPFLYVIDGTVSGTYTPYAPTTHNLDDDIFLSNTLPAISLCGKDSGVAKADSIAANGSLNVYWFPEFLKGNGIISFHAKLTSFDEIFVGFGNGGTNSIQVKVDASNMYIYKSGTFAWGLSFAHGLTISDFIDITFDNDFFHPKVTIATKSGLFVKTMDEFPSLESYGRPYAILGANTVATDAELRATSDKFRKPIWVIGDSFTSMYTERWTYQMVKTFGIDDFLICGLAGGGSSAMYDCFSLYALRYGTPKYLIWCLGMNDAYATWESNFNKLKGICEKNGIELILQTIPIPNLETSSNQEQINEAIKASGYRYIDACAAMCPNNTWPWYDGFCADGVHPTVLGAKVLAARFLSDFPEFLQ